MGNSNKSKIILVIVLILIGSGIYILNAKINKPLPKKQTTNLSLANLTPSPDQIVNWKAYKNTTYGYSLKYPEKLNVKEKGNNNIIFFKQNELNPNLEINLLKNINPNKEIINSKWLMNFNKKLPGGFPPLLKVEQIEEVTINGKNSLKVIESLNSSLVKKNEVKFYIPLDQDVLFIVFNFWDNEQIDNQLIINLLFTIKSN